MAMYKEEETTLEPKGILFWRDVVYLVGADVNGNTDVKCGRCGKPAIECWDWGVAVACVVSLN